jgi:hypothetical protein
VSLQSAEIHRIPRYTRPSAPELWVNYETTAGLWAITVGALSNLRKVLQPQGHWSVEWRPNSARLDAAGRGCGILFLKADVERVALIRRRCRCTIRQAIRIYDAIAREGPL